MGKSFVVVGISSNQLSMLFKMDFQFASVENVTVSVSYIKWVLPKLLAVKVASIGARD